MKFLIEKDYDKVELSIILDLLRHNKYLHEYEIIEDIDVNKDYKDFVPIGRIPFVNKYFKTQYGIEQQNPIEIPACMCTPEFLKRDYSIVNSKSLPRKGKYFIKDVSVLKNFTFDGELEYFLFDEMFEPKQYDFDCIIRIDSTHLYQVSESVNILSEWRVYIIRGEIENIANYNGDVTLFPDIDLIKKADNLYKLQGDYPKSYSFDVMINARGTSIVEVHTFSSLGLYCTVWGDNLLYAYADAKDYILKHNTPIKELEVKYEK